MFIFTRHTLIDFAALPPHAVAATLPYTRYFDGQRRAASQAVCLLPRYAYYFVATHTALLFSPRPCFVDLSIFLLITLTMLLDISLRFI